MEISYLIRGIVIGFSIAAVVGPIGVLCIHRTLARGFWYGLITGMGAATADATYGSIAAFGLAVITNFLVSQLFWIHLVGGLFLCYLGCKTLLSRPAVEEARVKASGYLSAYISTFFLTLTNPTTILSFLAIFAGLSLGGSSDNTLAALLIVGGVFVGSALWWLVLSGGLSILRSRFKISWLIWVNRLSGVIILLFGAYALLGLLLS